jgi:hypothetical protein
MDFYFEKPRHHAPAKKCFHVKKYVFVRHILSLKQKENCIYFTTFPGVKNGQTGGQIANISQVIGTKKEKR